MPDDIQDPYQEYILREIEHECDLIKEILLEKNRSYGNSLFRPINIFSKAGVVEGINKRLDDKFARIVRNTGGYPGDDDECDINGYLILKRVAKRVLTYEQFMAQRLQDSSDRVIGGTRERENDIRDVDRSDEHIIFGHGTIRGIPTLPAKEACGCAP